jgi:uncharacterized protein
MPIKPICRTDCKGLCTICGVNLNDMTCEHHPEFMAQEGEYKGEEEQA